MKRHVGMLVCALWVGALAAAPPAAGATAKGICRVCKVMEGAAAAEAIKASRTYEGKQYGFCSDKCAKAFEADPAAFVPPVFPRPAPAFELNDLAGNIVSTRTLSGKVVLLDFWATWCAPCRKSMPALQALHDKYLSRGFTVVGISIDEGGPGKLMKYLASNTFTYPIAIDSEQSPVWDAFRVKAVPAAYLLDRDGRIVAQWNGAAVDERELETKLEGLLGVR